MPASKKHIARPICCAGLFWKADGVNWKSSVKTQWKLEGERIGKKSKKVNFAEQVGIYTLHNGFELVYIGQVGAKKQTLYSRLKLHRNSANHERWDKFSWFGLKRVLKSNRLAKKSKNKGATFTETLNQLEAVLICVANPPPEQSVGQVWPRNGVVFAMS